MLLASEICKSFFHLKTKLMSKSKIAIVIAPSLTSWDHSTAIAAIISQVSDAGGTALIIPSQNCEDSIEEILQMADGVVLVCPEFPDGDGDRSIEPDDKYLHSFGRLAILSGINS